MDEAEPEYPTEEVRDPSSRRAFLKKAGLFLGGALAGALGMRLYDAHFRKGEIPTTTPAPKPSPPAIERPNDESSYVVLPKEKITRSLRPLPSVWQNLIQDDYTLEQKRLLHFRREWIYDPLSWRNEIGKYQPDQRVIVVPSIWTPLQQNITLESQIEEAMPHEIGHFTMTLIEEESYQGPSRTDIAAALEPTIECLQTKYREKHIKRRRAELRMPELLLYETIITSIWQNIQGSGSFLDSTTFRTYDVEQNYEDICQRLGDMPELRAQAEDVYHNIQAQREELAAIANEGQKRINEFIEDPQNPQCIYSYFNVSLVDTVEKYLGAIDTFAKVLEELHRKLPKGGAMYSRIFSIYSDYQPIDKLVSATLEHRLHAERLKTRVLLTPEKEREILKQAEQRFSLDEVFANSIRGLVLLTEREWDQEIFPCPPSLLPLLVDMRYKGDLLFAPLVDELASRAFYPSEKNTLEIKGEIPYLN